MSAVVRKSQTPTVRFIEPMKPVFVAALPEGKLWTYEVKWDGYRAQILKQGDDIQLLSRNAKTLGRTTSRSKVMAKARGR